MSEFDGVRAVANAVLYEGYLLYPYTADARKNQYRWQFGVIAPRSYASTQQGETWSVRTEALAQCADEPEFTVLVRFLHLQERIIEEGAAEPFVRVERTTVDGTEYITWDEAVEVEVACTAGDSAISIPGHVDIEPIVDGGGAMFGRIVRRRSPLAGTVSVEMRRVGDFVALCVRIENHSAGESSSRNEALRRSFLSAHALLHVRNGRFVSLHDPPPHAMNAAQSIANNQLWPVLVGNPADAAVAQTMLASPIILYDYPQVAPESDGDKFDATEIDELLNLSIASLSDEEKRVARITDAHGRALVDRAEALAPEHYAKLHGALRYLGATASDHGSNGHGAGSIGQVDEADPGGGRVVVAGTEISTGSKVRLRPSRRADVWDAFLDGRTASVSGVYEDLEGNKYVAVTVDDDPAHDLHEWYGRYFYFYPNEIVPLERRL